MDHQSVSLADSVCTEPKVPRTAARQQHRDNSLHGSPKEYYRRSVVIPFLDYLISELKVRFSETQRKASKLLCLAPNMVNESDKRLIETISETYYAEDLPSRSTLDTDYRKWKRKWAIQEAKPKSLEGALQDCDRDVFPNIHTLLRIACTLPVTSAENERSNSDLKRLKNYLRFTMDSDRLSALALMQIHRSASVDFNKIVSQFAKLHLRRMLLSSPLLDDN